MVEDKKMPINTAKNCFLGKEGLKKLNCAQSVITAFKEMYSIDNDTVESFRQYGGGKAPEGMCGAYYAAKVALEKKNPEKIAKMENALKKLKAKKVLKVELKNISLGTSKINYIDPRITIAFLKKHDIPVDKIFSKTLQEKFKWAMETETDFVF